MHFTLRKFLIQLIKSGLVLCSIGSINSNIFCSQSNSIIRRFHLSLSAQALVEIPELPSIIRTADVTDIWLAAFLYGRWFRSPMELRMLARRLEKEGFNIHFINVPLIHPGDALGVENESISTTPLGRWKNACTFDGQIYSGTSIHPPAVKENAQALKELQVEGFDSVFLDDDFRIAKYPGHIGGCFYDDCRDEFLTKHGYTATDWETLIGSVKEGHPSPALRAWVDFWCDKLYAMFTTLQNAAPEIEVGIMVIYLGFEKAGIPLDRFSFNLFRVDELMFSDKDFSRVKGNTDELFSALSHRRFAQPELAYSETTAFPSDKLSAQNMAAKPTILLIADVRNTI